MPLMEGNVIFVFKEYRAKDWMPVITNLICLIHIFWDLTFVFFAYQVYSGSVCDSQLNN